MDRAQRALPPAPGRRAGRDQLRDRAEGGRPGDLARLRGRRVRAGSHTRQRRGRRAGDREPADHRRHTAPDRGRAAAPRGPRRGVPAARRVRPAQRAARRGRRAHLREPAQLGRRLDPPARPQAHGVAAAVDVGLLHRRPRGGRVHLAVRVARMAARARLPGESGRGGARGPRRGRGRLPRLGAAARPARLRDRRRGGQGRRSRAAAAAWRGRARASRGDRLEVRAEHRHHGARAGRVERWPHRAPDPVRDARAGAGIGSDREARDAPQRGGPAAQGRARRATR